MSTVVPVAPLHAKFAEFHFPVRVFVTVSEITTGAGGGGGGDVTVVSADGGGEGGATEKLNCTLSNRFGDPVPAPVTNPVDAVLPIMLATCDGE
jgi:hypothetical protein